MSEPEPELEEAREQDAPSSPLRRGDSSQLCHTCSACELCAHLEVAPPPTPNRLSPRTPDARSLSRNVSAASPFSLVSSMSVDDLDELRPTSTRPPQTQQRERMETGLKIGAYQKNQRSVESKISAEDLTATWDDQQINGPDCDWRTCPVNARTWDQLDVSTRLKKKREARDRAAEKDKADESKLLRTRSAEQKKAAEAEAAAKVVEEAKRVEQAQRGLLFHSNVHEPEPEEDEDDDLAREDSLVSVASSGTSSSGGLPLWNMASVMKDVDDENKSGAMGANGAVLRAQWKGSVKVAIKVTLTLGMQEDIKQ